LRENFLSGTRPKGEIWKGKGSERKDKGNIKVKRLNNAKWTKIYGKKEL
jgi:hypothetical protein